ncbi:hypothetical protein HK103_003073 [Boothiomyces macroporosus]|uniref:F-box domain-containing protein n=1 Tax=Boothiomyces macroporosus TaxID=261099 RepID=A0AAD5U8V0_9FUNG|nr:hypothetical protein HK103_003073 [Boothiomyces macroporosus]
MISDLNLDLLEHKIIYYLSGSDLLQLSMVNRNLYSRLSDIQTLRMLGLEVNSVWPVLYLNCNGKILIPDTLLLKKRVQYVDGMIHSNWKLRFLEIVATTWGFVSMIFPKSFCLHFEFKHAIHPDYLIQSFKWNKVHKLTINPYFTDSDYTIAVRNGLYSNFYPFEYYLATLLSHQSIKTLSFQITCPIDAELLVQYLPILNIKKLEIVCLGDDFSLKVLSNSINSTNIQSLKIDNPLILYYPIRNLQDLYLRTTHYPMKIKVLTDCLSLTGLTKLTIEFFSCFDTNLSDLFKLLGNTLIIDLGIKTYYESEKWYEAITSNIHHTKLETIRLDHVNDKSISSANLQILLEQLVDCHRLRILGIPAKDFHSDQVELLIDYLPKLSLSRLYLYHADYRKNYLDYVKCGAKTRIIPHPGGIEF